MTFIKKLNCGVILIGAAGSAAFAQNAEPADTPASGGRSEYSPYVEYDYPDQALFGDTHLHTAYSADAGLVGATTSPDDAYRFAKGEEVTASSGVRARLGRPLDWLVVTDHAENLGLPIALFDDDPILQETEWGRDVAETFRPQTYDARVNTYIKWFGAVNTPDGVDPMKGSGLNQTMWQRITEAAERHNQPDSFSALIGFEWTSGPSGANLHRNVIFRDGKEEADQIVPISAYDSEDPEVLWNWMSDYEAKTGGKMLAITHNGNLSNGLMFDDVTLSGEPLDRDFAERRMRWEPLYEITQIKGDSETHPLISPDDEFADYYSWDKGSFGPGEKTPDMLPREYARGAWKRGLLYDAKLGANPFKFGVVGSTDSHTGLSTADEDSFFGKVSLLEPGTPTRYTEAITGRFTPDDSADDMTHGDALASGLAVVWARENTREAIWDAMKRKETYATTGTRIRVRLFGGWDFAPEDMNRADFARYGYMNGVPMGGDLPEASAGGAPGFLVRAERDPDGANLDRVQIVKGWTTPEGGSEEKVYDVVWSGDRVIGEDGKLPAVGNTVDLSVPTYSNEIGSPYLATYWQDPDFDPAQRAFYYVRVLEIPTPSWLAFDQIFFGTDIPEGKPMVQQERAYTSPIWYQPAG